MTPNDTMHAMNAGIAATDDLDPEAAKAKAREEADVKRWGERIDEVSRFDEDARKQYAIDRGYARGDTGAEVSANLVGTNIDILEAFLYARDPDFDVTPGPSVQPPSDDALREAAEQMIGPMPPVMGEVAGMLPGPIAGPMVEQVRTIAIDGEVAKMKLEFGRKKREVKSFCDTAEIVGARLWHDAALKRRGRPFVRSALTIGLGILKASWQERTAQSPEAVAAINDLQANIARARALQAEVDEGEGSQDELIADLERQITALRGQVERVVARGFVVDLVAGEDFRVAPGYTIGNHLDAPWNAHRIFMRYEDAVAEFGPHLAQYAADPSKPNAGADLLKTAVIYYPRKPAPMKTEAALLDDKLDAKDADAYITSADPGSAEASGKGYVALWEVWDRDSNTVMTYIEGVRCWVKPQWTPPATTRFYPFFVLALSEVDGQRHPQSLVTRTMKLVDEYNRIGSAEAEHRRRVMPGVLFDSGAIQPAGAKKIEASVTGEFTGIERTGKQPWGEVFFPKPYAPLDPALYDRERIIQEIERIWGVQEALSGAVNVAKTATEADIQQQGFQARSSSRRDLLESVLSELARYTIEIARVYLSHEDVVAIAGTSAFWPPYGGPEDVTQLVNVEIRAGSSGKPNTAAERESWSTMLPLLQEGITAIAQLRGADPLALADSLEQLLRITAEKTGDRIDIDSLVPQVGVMGPPMLGGPPGAPAPEGAPPGAPPAPPTALAA